MDPVGGVARAGPSAGALLLDLARQGATGRVDLTLETGVVVWVWLRDGQVCSVSGPHERPLLGATLLAGGAVTSGQLSTALALAREDASRPDLALVLIESGIPAVRVRAARALELRAALEPALLGRIVATSFHNGLILPGAQLTVAVDDLMRGPAPGGHPYPVTTPTDASEGTAVPPARHPQREDHSPGTQGHRPEHASAQPAGDRQPLGPHAAPERATARHGSGETESPAAGSSTRPIRPAAPAADPAVPYQDPTGHDHAAAGPTAAEPGVSPATAAGPQSQDQRHAHPRPATEPADTATESMSPREVIEEFRGVYD